MATMIEGFDPTFDDTAWTLDWLPLPLAQVEPGDYRDGYRVVRDEIGQMDIFGRPYRFDPPFRRARAARSPGRAVDVRHAAGAHHDV